MSNLYEKIDSLCKECNIKASKMCDDLKMSRSFMSELRSGRAKSVKVETASKLAAYFNVPVSFLTGDQPFEIWDNFKNQRKVLLENMRLPKELSKSLLDGKEIDEISLIEYINFIDFTIDLILPLSDDVFVATTKPWVSAQAREEENKHFINLSDFFTPELEKPATNGDELTALQTAIMDKVMRLTPEMQQVALAQIEALPEMR